jgi:hypothetical protein
MHPKNQKQAPGGSFTVLDVRYAGVARRQPRDTLDKLAISTDLVPPA